MRFRRGIADVREERDAWIAAHGRLREALERIAVFEGDNYHATIAREALGIGDTSLDQPPDPHPPYREMVR